MALNLNKNEGENQTPSNEKKGLNLNKSEDSNKAGLNLSKTEASSEGGLNFSKSEDSSKRGLNLSKTDDLSKVDSNVNSIDDISKDGIDLSNDKINTDFNSVNSENQSEPKNKSPFMLIAIIVISALGIFWFINRDNDKSPEVPVMDAPTVVNDTISSQTEVTSDTVQTEQPIATSSTTQEASTNADPVNSTTSKPIINSNSSVGKNNDSSISSSKGTIEEKVKQVLDGVFGNGEVRKRALGTEYEAIQAKVNEIYRNKK